MKCPYCDGSNIESVEGISQSKEYGLAIACSDCGLSSPVVAGLNDNAHELASRLFASIQIERPSFHVLYSSGKNGFSSKTRLFVISCILLISAIVFSIGYVAGR